MEKLKNKNTLVLIISGLLILVAIIVAVVATATADKDTAKSADDTSESQSVSLDLKEIAGKNDETPDTTGTSSASSNKTTSYSYSVGTYKIATKDDPLGLRLEPNTKSDRLVFIPIGTEIEVLAVWEDWGYVVYNKTGGWLSMNYLELVTSSNSSDTATDSN